MAMSINISHHKLKNMAYLHGSKKLMEFILGSTCSFITWDIEVSKELLTLPKFSNILLKESTQWLLFGRAIGLYPNGVYSGLLNLIYSSNVFAPCKIIAHEVGCQVDVVGILVDIQNECQFNAIVRLQEHLQGAVLKNIMGSVYSRRLDMSYECLEVRNIGEIVDERSLYTYLLSFSL